MSHPIWYVDGLASAKASAGLIHLTFESGGECLELVIPAHPALRLMTQIQRAAAKIISPESRADVVPLSRRDYADTD